MLVLREAGGLALGVGADSDAIGVELYALVEAVLLKLLLDLLVYVVVILLEPVLLLLIGVLGAHEELGPSLIVKYHVLLLELPLCGAGIHGLHPVLAVSVVEAAGAGLALGLLQKAEKVQWIQIVDSIEAVVQSGLPPGLEIWLVQEQVLRRDLVLREALLLRRSRLLPLCLFLPLSPLLLLLALMTVTDADVQRLCLGVVRLLLLLVLLVEEGVEHGLDALLLLLVELAQEALQRLLVRAVARECGGVQ